MNHKIFWLILFIAFILRFYRLGEVPLTLNWDETSNAYNAYSIAKTGRDEYGDFLPITNRSFDDYKPPLYMYLNIPSVAVFGLTPFAARLPSAFFGFLTVPTVYFLASWLFRNLPAKKNQTISQLSMFFLAISPWHLQFSRVGFESTVGLFFATAAITFFLWGLGNYKLLILSSVALGISAYSYHSQRIFIPLLFIATSIIFRKELFKISKKYLIIFIIITMAIGFPLVVLISPKVILKRFETTSSGPKLEDIERSIKFINQDRESNFPLENIIHNRRAVIGQTYIGNYLSHFDFNFLFTVGDDNFRHHIQDMGMLYLFELPLIILAIYKLIGNPSKESLFIFSWLLIAPIPAIPATPDPHAVRSFPLIIAYVLLSSFGLTCLLWTSFKFKRAFLYLCAIVITSSLVVYLHNYWAHYPVEKASFWQFGYSTAANESEKFKDQFEKINVDKSLEQAYIFWLFATNYDPGMFQATGTRSNFDKYYFDAKQPTKSNELFIAEAGRFPGGFETLKTIYYPDGSEAIIIGHPKQ